MQDIYAHPTLAFLYVMTFNNGINGYTQNTTTGALTAMTGSPFFSGTYNIVFLSFDNAGNFAYGGDTAATTASVLCLAVNQTTGALTYSSTTSADNVTTSAFVNSTICVNI